VSSDQARKAGEGDEDLERGMNVEPWRDSVRDSASALESPVEPPDGLVGDGLGGPVERNDPKEEEGAGFDPWADLGPLQAEEGKASHGHGSRSRA